MASLAISCTMPNSPVDSLPAPYAVAMHDAGAANLIAAWVDAAARPPQRVMAAGPARSIWLSRFGDGSAITATPDCLAGMASVLTGTGWASDFEHRARLAAARLGIGSIAVVDHWVNYTMRFERDGRWQMPDTIWVADHDALRIARRTFADTDIEQHPNLYLPEQAKAAGCTPIDGDVLFLMEPAHSDWGRTGPGEFQALDYFMARRALAAIPPRTPLRIRPHPSDPPDKYCDWISQHPSARLDRSPDMASALRGARWVAGLHSAGLVIALEAGRTAITALPPHAPPCALPHEGLVKLAAL